MKKVMIAMMMVLGFQSQVSAQLNLSSGITQEQIQEMVWQVSSMCKRDATEKKNSEKGSEVAKELIAGMPKEISVNPIKKKDYLTVASFMYMSCMISHIKK